MGMHLLRRQVERNFAENPRLNVNSSDAASASGQRPNEAMQQVYRQIVSQQKAALAKSKRKNNFLVTGFFNTARKSTKKWGFDRLPVHVLERPYG